MFIPFLPSLFSESKKEKKERKEKKKKRDSKDLETSSNDFTVENEEKDGSSSNSKSVFGMFRRSGRKDKRSSKHGSSDSLKRLSVDSTEFGDRRSSGVSIDESASVKVSTPSTEVVKETEKPETQRDQPSEVKIVSAAHPAPVENKDSERPDVPLAAEILKTVDTMMANNGEEEVQTKKDEEESVITPDNDKGSLKQEEQIAEKEPEPVVEMESQLQEANTKEHKQEESVSEQVLKPDNPDQEVLLKIGNGPAVEKEEVHSLKKGQQKENQFQVQVEEFLKLDAKVGEVSTLKAKSEEQDEKEIGNGSAVEKEEVHSLEKGQQKENQFQLQVEEFLKLDATVGEVSTLKAKSEEQDEKEIGNGSAVEKEEVHSLEKGQQKENQFQLQVEEFLKLDATVGEVSTLKAKNEEQDKKEIGDGPTVEKEEVHSLKKGQQKENQFQVQVEEFLKLNAKVGEVSTPKAKSEGQNEKEIGNGPAVEKEEVHTLEKGRQRENQIHLQVKEFLKLDAKVGEISTPKAENEEQEEKGERKSVEDSERRFNVIHKTPPFKGEGTFTTSTPKRESTKRAQVEKSGGPEIQVQSTNRAIKGDKQTSVVEFHFEAQIGNDITDAKFSTEVLLAQLIEVNKKLRMLQEELLEFRKSNGKLA